MKCSYCSKEIGPGKGLMFVNKTSSINYFCSGTCFKNSKNKRSFNKNTENKRNKNKISLTKKNDKT